MKKGIKTLQQSIASNKFYPPRINTSQSLQRHTIITDRLVAPDSSRKIIVIEAQAGQGKTTLAYQYIDHSGYPFVWYQIGPEDGDQLLFLSALHLAFTRKFSDFSSPQLASIFEEGQIGPLDFNGCVNILFHDIDNSIPGDIFIVLDDLHLVEDVQVANDLLNYLLDSSPPHIHFILTSRHRLKLKAQILTKPPVPLFLNTKDLALEIHDIEKLYQIVFGTSITRNEAEDIMEITNGWVMGIVLAAHPYTPKSESYNEDGSDKQKRQLSAEHKDGYILNYFEEEIFSHVSDQLHDAFLHLSFLDEIDITLAQQLTEIEEIDGHLTRMADENFFVYRLDDDNNIFRFHHLFQEFLQIKARQKFGDNRINHLYNRIADYYLDHDLTEKALKSLRNGNNFSRMETLLKRWGLRLVANNRTATILGILQSIPDSTLLEHTWLAFFHGLLATDTNPRQTLPYFEVCRTQFAQNNDEAGELMSLSQIIYFHFVISGRYHLGSMLLPRTQTLFERNHAKLPDEITIIVARNLAAGYCFFDGKLERAHHFAKLGYELAKKRGSGNFIAATRFILGYIGLLGGNRRTAISEIENSLHLASDPLVGMSNRITLYILQLCELSMHGNFCCFQHQKNLVQASVYKNIVRQTVAAPYLYIWTAIEQIAEGKPNEAIGTLDQGMLVSKTASIDHMTSQFLQWRGFAHAINENNEQALKDIETSTSLRHESGGPFYIAYNYAITGASLVLLGLHDDADKLLRLGLKTAREIPSPYIEACCHAYLATIAVKENDLNRTEDTIRNWLEIMKENDFYYFWGWEPEIAATLLRTAVKMKILPAFAQSCAWKRLGITIMPDGTSIPRAQLQILDDFSIRLQGKEIIVLSELSGLQRELLGLLISSPGLSISPEQIQLALWPDNDPDKARNSMDALTSRLRNVLKKAFPISVKKYFQVEKGVVQLTNLSVDGIDFITCVRDGLKLARQEKWWQAGNAFVTAFSLWQNFTLTELFISDQALALYDTISELLRELCLTWCSLLIKQHRLEEAILVLEKTEKILAQDDDCIALRYSLYIKKNQPVKASELLAAYRQELLHLAYSEEETEQIITNLTRESTLP